MEELLRELSETKIHLLMARKKIETQDAELLSLRASEALMKDEIESIKVNQKSKEFSCCLTKTFLFPQTSNRQKSNVSRHNHSNQPDHKQKGDIKLSLFISGLTPKTDEQTLKSHFAKMGNVVDVLVAKTNDSNQQLSFGFLKFSSYFAEHPMEFQHVIDGK